MQSPRDESSINIGAIKQIRAERTGATMISRSVYDAQSSIKLELERVEAEWQSLTDRFQRSFLKTPKLEEHSRGTFLFDGTRFRSREVRLSELDRFDDRCPILQIDAEPVRRRPRTDET